MLCENKKNNPPQKKMIYGGVVYMNAHCRGTIKGRIRYAGGMKVCDRCFDRLEKERKEKEKPNN